MSDRGFLTPVTTSSTLRHVAVYALLVGAYSALAAWKEHSHYATVADLPSEIHAALSLVLGWLLVFRTNVAYARWWEARTLWGNLVNASRNLAVKIAANDIIPWSEMQVSQRIIVGFAPLLRDHLRNEVSVEQWDFLKDATPEGQPDHVPLYKHPPSEFVRRLYLLLAHWRRGGQISEMDFRIIDTDLSRLLDICGGCERIRGTRVVRSYRIFARQCVWLFLATFPWGIADDFGWWTIPMTVITAYFMIGLETVAEHVEDPFGYDEDDLDLDGMCRTIAGSVEEIFSRRNEMPIFPAWSVRDV